MEKRVSHANAIRVQMYNLQPTPKTAIDVCVCVAKMKTVDSHNITHTHLYIYIYTYMLASELQLHTHTRKKHAFLRISVPLRASTHSSAVPKTIFVWANGGRIRHTNAYDPSRFNLSAHTHTHTLRVQTYDAQRTICQRQSCVSANRECQNGK